MTIVTTGVEWIDTMSSPCIPGVNLSSRQGNAEGFQGAMAAQGHISVFDWGDQNAWETDFRSPANGGDSLNWSDNVNFCFYSDHGGNDASKFNIGFTGQQANCFGYSNTWQLGAKSLKWMVFDCCNLVLGTDVANVIEWFGPMQGVHIVFGFVGEAYDDPGQGTPFGNDAADGANLSDSWLADAVASGGSQTAIAIAAGASQSEAITRRDIECIPWRDFDVTATNWLAWKWYG